jgi:serine protease
MKRLLIFSLFFLGLTFALWNFSGAVNQGTYQSYVLDFKAEVPQSVIENKLNTLEEKYNVTTKLNSEFSERDRVYIVKSEEKLPTLNPLI